MVTFGFRCIFVPKEIVDASKHNSRNILVRSIAYDAINRNLLPPSQEMKRIPQEHMSAKSTNIGSGAIPLNEKRTNPNSSAGLYVNDEIRVRARVVHNVKLQKAESHKIKKQETMLKHALKLNKKVDSYDTVKHHLELTSPDFHLALTKHSTYIIIHVYQYLDGVLSHLPNKQIHKIVALLFSNPLIQSIRSNIKVDKEVEELQPDDEDAQEDEMVDVYPSNE